MSELNFKTIVRSLGDMVLPRICVVCGEELMLSEEYICLKCLADMPYTYFWQEEHNPMADHFNERISAAPEEPYCYAMALFNYNSESPYRHITPHLKYGEGVESGRFFAGLLAQRIAECPYLQDVDCIVPVPLHWRRRLERGYNQAEVIASACSEALHIPMHPELLSRVRYARSQTRTTLNSKAANVLDAFRAHPISDARSHLQSDALDARSGPGMTKRQKGDFRHILIVDDVFTTGSTLASCHDALRELYSADIKISVATLAFVSPS